MANQWKINLPVSRKTKKNAVVITQEDCDKAIEDFLTSGGVIQKLENAKPNPETIFSYSFTSKSLQKNWLKF